MKKIHNIFIKMFLLLALAIGWGGSAWAERLTPAFDGTYYYIKFANINRYMYNGSSADVEISTNAPGTFRDERYMWQLVGDASSFQLVNANGQYLKLTGSRGDNGCYQLAAGSAGAANFTLDEWSTTAEFWELKNIDRNIFVNPRPNSGDNFVSHYSNNDNNNKVEFVPVEAPLLKASPAPEAGSWGDGTQWYKIHNVRAASRTDKDGYLATEGENFVDGEGNLKLWAAGEPEGDASLWCLVLAENGCVNIYNKGTGTSKVLGTVNNAGNGDTRSKMCVGTGSETNVTKAYSLGTNEEGFWICLSGTNKHLDENNSSGYLSVYDNNSDTKTNPGNRFIFHEVITTIPVTPTFDPAAGNVTSLASVTVNFTEDVYNVVDSEAAGMPSGAVQLMPEILRRSDDAVVATATSVNSSGSDKPYTITFNTALPDGEYTLRIPDGTFYVLDGSTWTAAAGARVNYTLVNPPATEGYKIIINGDNGYTVSTTAAVKSGSQSAVNGGYLDLAAAPTANDLRGITINCTDKFVWGPAIDDVNKTITFDVRDAASSFTAGRWYQLQMREKTGQWYANGSIQGGNSSNMIDGINAITSSPTLRNKGSQLYLMSSRAEGYPIEINGYESEAYHSFVYVEAVNGNSVTLHSQNGNYVNNNGSGQSSSTAVSLAYDSGVKAFSWGAKTAPWSNTGTANWITVGMSSSFTNATGNIQIFAHPVKSDEDYAMYKVVLDDGDVATYTGSSTLYVATGAELSTTKTTIVNGDVIFLPKGIALQLTDFTFSEGGEHIFTEDKSSDIWTLNMTLVPTEYPLTPDTEYTLTPANGTKFAESLSEVTVTITLDGGKTVQSAKEKNGTFTADELPYLIPLSVLSNHRSPSKAAPAGAIVAADVEKTDDGVYSISFSPAVTADDDYTLVVPAGAFYVSDGGNELPTAEFRATYTVGDPTQWFTIKNTRSNKFISVSAAGLTNAEELKWGVTEANTAGEYWKMVEDGNTGFYLVNKAYGDDYVLGMESTNNGASLRMYHISEAVSANTHFGRVSTTNGGFSIVQYGNNSIGFHDLGGQFKIWNGNSVNDGGSNFVFTEVENTALTACPAYNVYKVVISTGAASPSAAYTGAAADVLGLTTIPNGRYLVLKKSAGVPTESSFNVSPSVADTRFKSYAGGAYSSNTLLFYVDERTMGNDVVLQFVDRNGDPVSDGEICYRLPGQPAVVLTLDESPYDFASEPYADTFFTSTYGYTFYGSTFDRGTNTLTIRVEREVNTLMFSPEPQNGHWAASTKWFYLHNNRNNNASWNRRYLTTAAVGTNDDFSLTVKDVSLQTRPTDNGGVWCFVGDNTNGFYIQNAAYGPDFVLANRGNRFMMVPKGDYTDGTTTKFRYNDKSSVKEGASVAYVFLIGDTDTDIHINVNDLNTYAGGPHTGDSGSSFKVEAVSNITVDHDVYLVDVIGSNFYTALDYTPSNSTFGKRGTAMDGNILIVDHNSPIAVGNFTIAPATEFTIENVTTEAVAGHYYKRLIIEESDKLADDFTIVVTNGTTGAFDVSSVDVSLYKKVYHNGDMVITRAPHAIDVVASNYGDKFIWGPVIDKTAKTITFDIRDRATTFETGLYQLCLKGQSDIDDVNHYIDMFDQNVNTSSQYIYLAPSIYKNQGAKMKFTGVPRNAAEPSTYIYIKDNGNGTVNISASGQAEIQNIPYTFSNGEITFDGYSYIRYDTERPDTGEQWRDEHPIYDPMEQPALEQKSGRSTTFILHPTSMVEYDAYTLVFDGEYTSLTTVRYTKPTPTGVTTFTNNDMFVVDKGYTAFLSTDFLPNDARCTAVRIESTPTETDLGVLKLTLSLPVSDWNVVITGAAADVANDRVVYKGVDYTSGSTVSISGAPIDLTTIKTNVTDRFVWGPVVNEDTRTISFDIRPLATDVVDGWYQIQLLGDDKVADANYRISHNNGNINTAASYIYVLPMYNNTNAVLGKFGGVPTYAGEASSYFHITRDGGSIRIQSPDGRYVRNDGALEYGQTDPNNIGTWQYTGNQFKVNKWTAPGQWQTPGTSTNMGGNAGNQGPIVATGGSYHEEHYITQVDPTALYDVYQVDLTSTAQDKVNYKGTNSHGNTKVYNNGYLFLTKGDAAPTKEQFGFDSKLVTIESIAIDANKVITFTVSTPVDDLTNTVIHCQHAVYDLLESLDGSYVPSKNHIQPGEGMIDHPNADKFGGTKTVPNPEYNPNLDPSDPTPNPETITVAYSANDSRIQNTSVFEITQYVPKGGSTMCVLPFTMDNSAGNYVREYQRIYDYLTECPLDAAIRGTQLDDYHLATNGHYTRNGWAGHVQPRNVHTFTLPSGKDEVWIAIDCSAFSDSQTLPNGNVLEPSLSSRVIFHLISAEKMASNLKTSGDADEDWFEHAEYYVPNVKRGSDDHGNNADLLPLSMPYTNYWFHKTLGSTDPADLMPIAPETGDAANMTTVANNVKVVIEGTTPTGEDINNYLEAGVFSGDYPGTTIKSEYPNVNHFVYYKYKGSDLKRVIPEGSTAVIKVYAQYISPDDASPLYQIGKYTLKFQADAEPLAITSIVGNPNSTRSEEYFIKNRFSQVASLTFENKELPFASVHGMSGLRAAAQTYAFPIDFSRTSYAYNSDYQFGTYSVSRRGYGIQFQPVALYEKNIKNPASTQITMTDDYFFYIDAAEAPGKVASVPLDGTLCTGSRLYCYGWMSSDNLHTRAGGAVVLNFIGRDADGTPHVLASYLSGNVSDVAYDEDGTAMRSLAYGRTPSWHEANWGDDRATLLGAWQQIGFSFSLDRTYEGGYELEIINNAYSTGGGDYVLDDFRVYVAPARPTVEFNAPVCFDHVPHMKVTLPREAIENNHVDAEGFVPVSYCFVDKEKYYEKLTALAGDAAPTDAQYNVAFNYALLGNGTATDGSEVDGKPESIRSFWNMKAAYTDAAYDSYKDYNFGKIISGDSDYPIDGVYRQISGASHNIVFSMPIRNSDGWEDNREYIIFFRHGHVTSDFNTAGTGYYNIHVLDCQSSDVFKMSPSLRVNSDMAELATDPPSACAGQVATISADMFGYGPINKVELPHMMYDWWIGYGKVNETDPVEAANVHNFAQLQYGGVYLLNALDNFRAFYPKANEVESSEPQSGEVDGLGHVDYTQADKDCILHFLEPNENGRVPLVLGSRIINIHMLERDAVEENGKKYIYSTIVPITPYVAYDGNDDVIFCPDPQQFKILIDQKAPHMFDGFTALHDDYPASMDNVPVRIGLRQIEAVRLDAKGNMGTHHLRVPLRGVELANTGKPCPIIKNRHKKHTAEESYNDYLTLVYTDDPLYADRMIVGVDELGNMDLLKVGRLQAYNANVGKTNASHSEIGFARDFQPREGYVYTLKLWYEENTDGIEDTFVPCPGSLIFDLKIVPEYAQWTAAKDNTDWTNDRNWARADRDVLHADNATSTLVDKSNAAHPYAAYSDNATNYSGDARYKSGDDASAHVFTPMYFTNVLMHDADLRAPEMYTHTAPEAGTSFLGGLKAATATKFIEYDMLATPISQQGSFQGGDDGMTPLALTDRYGVYDKNFGCELFWTNVCNGLTFEPGTMMYDAQHLQYNRVWVEYELSTNRWYTLASPLKGIYAGEWYSPEAGGRQLTPHFYPVTYNPDINDRFNPAYYQRSWDKAGQAWIYRMAGDDDTYVGFDQQSLNSGSVRVQKPVYLNWSYVYNDVAVDYSNGGFSVNAHYTDTDSDGHLLNATGGKVLVRMPKDDLSYDYYQSEAAAHYDKTHPAGGNEQNPDTTQPGTVPGRDDYGNGDNDAGNNPDGSNADGSGNATGRNNADGNNNEYTPKQGNKSYYGDNTELENRKLDSEGHYPHPRLMSDDLKTGGTIAQSIQNASATNPYYLVGNPFMAPMNMDEFFAQQTCTRNGHAESTFSGEKYWMLGTTQQDVYQKVAGVWISNSSHNDAGVVAPLQGFFVQMPTNAGGEVILPDNFTSNPPVSSISLSFNESMQQHMTVIDEDNDGKPIFGYIAGEDAQGQTIRGEKPSLKSRRRSAELEQPATFRITATNGSPLESTAVVYFHDKASAHYDAREDAETLLDGNIASKVSTVFTSAPSLSGPQDELVSGQDQQALQINTMPVGVTVIPVGVIAPKDDTRTTLCFTGLDALEAAMAETPHLYDAAEGTLQVLDEGTTVNVTGTTAGRYFIVSGTTLPELDDNDDDNADLDGRIYDLRGIRVNSVQHGTVTISRSRKEYNK